jgi:serine/threonine protein kinase
LSEPLPALRLGASLKLPALASNEALKSPDFEVVEVMRGGMGACVHVRHKKTGGEYALKTILPGGLEQDSAYRRFLEEIKIWFTLSSNGGIVQAYCVERVNEIPFICAKWMKHGSLRRFLSVKSPKFFFETMDRIARTLGWAWVTYLVVHRDLKPDNILFNSKDWPYVADWGIARTVLDHRHLDGQKATVSRTPANLKLTMPGSPLGTLLYASPEQLIDATSADQRSDIYSLGCVMFEWETGTPPFFEGSQEDIAYAHLYKAAPRLGGWAKESNFGAEKVIAKCLEKRPDSRFQDYEELSRALVDASRAKKVSWNPIAIAQLPLMPRVSWDEFGDRLAHDKTAVRSKDKRHAVIDGEKYEPFLREADALLALGEWQKAANILGSLFVPELTQSNPDIPYLQVIAVNYGHCLTNLGKYSEALEVFQTISSAKAKSAEYFVNYSNALIHAQNYGQAEKVGWEGVQSFPTDKDILGNLTISLLSQEKLPEAFEAATRRVELCRDVHSLEELAGILHKLGRRREDDDWPEAFHLFKQAIGLLEEAKGLNPRYFTARFSLAQTWFDLEQYVRATGEMDEFRQMSMHESLREVCVGLMAQCMLWSGVFKGCVEFSDKWLAKFPGSLSLQRTRAEAIVDGFVISHMKDGVRVVEKSSLEFFESVVENTDQRKASDFCFLARLKNWMGFTGEALEILSHASALFPSAWEVSFHQANILLMAGDSAAAMHFARDAAHKGKWRAPAWELLARVYEALSKPEEAAASRQKGNDIKAEREKLKRALLG